MSIEIIVTTCEKHQQALMETLMYAEIIRHHELGADSYLLISKDAKPDRV